MRLGIETNGRSNELEMQDLFEKWIIERSEKYTKLNNEYPNRHYGKYILQYKREVTIPEVSRRADFLILRSNKLINIELKTNPSQILLDQLLDHKKYCDYSFALYPDFAVLPQWLMFKFYKNGIGIYVYNYEHKIFTEAIPAFYNQDKDKELNKKYKMLFSQTNLF